MCHFVFGYTYDMKWTFIMLFLLKMVSFFAEFGVGGTADASGDQLMEEGELSDHEDLRRTHLGKYFCSFALYRVFGYDLFF